MVTAVEYRNIQCSGKSEWPVVEYDIDAVQWLGTKQGERKGAPKSTP